jgi:glycosyltransferase involved in cell wall biosynthesis
VLIVTDDVLTRKMAGPAIRAWQVAEALGGHHDVVLATTSPTCDRPGTRFAAEACDQDRFAELEQWCDVVILQGYVLNHVPVLRHTDKVLLVDLYDPLHLETLELTRDQPEPARSTNVASSVRVLREQLTRGDFFVCASEKQRDLWLGFLSAVGRVNPATYDDDPTLRRLIDVVPFGLPDHPPTHVRQTLKGVVPGIGAADEVVLWGGGVYDWLDPLTLIHAIDKLRVRRPSVRLYFLGVRHPNPAIEESRTLTAARALADNLGLTGSHVFFNEDWVAYDDRQDYLLEADIGVSLHVEHVETAYSFRTRILDYLWAGLPIVATRGDGFADLIVRKGLGIVVPGEDVDAVEQGLFDLLTDRSRREECRGAAEAASRAFVWSDVLRPLLAFCTDPRRAPDVPEWPAEPPPVATPIPPPPAGWMAGARRDVLTAARLYREGGAGGLLRSLRTRIRQLLPAGTSRE